MDECVPLTASQRWKEIPVSGDLMEPLFPAPPRWYEVTVTAPHDGDADPLDLIPAGIPASAIAELTAARVRMTLKVKADSLTEAALLGCLAAGEWARMPGAEATVKPVTA